MSSEQDAALSFFVCLLAANMKGSSNENRNEENNFLLSTLCQDRRFQNDGDEWRDGKLQKEP